MSGGGYGVGGWIRTTCIHVNLYLTNSYFLCLTRSYLYMYHPIPLPTCTCTLVVVVVLYYTWI